MLYTFLLLLYFSKGKMWQYLFGTEFQNGCYGSDHLLFDRVTGAHHKPKHDILKVFQVGTLARSEK